jgi:xanthine dehydrogenase accessory factor
MWKGNSMAASIYHHLQQMIDQGQPVAVATIVDAKGSVPREVGAKMIIHPLGQHVGTVGGGCGEADVIRIALDVIQDGIPRTVHVDLTEDISMQSLGVCGGIMNVFIERWGRSKE